MKIWIDAHLSPDLAPWIAARFGVEARAVRDLGLRDAKDWQICQEVLEKTLAQALRLLEGGESLVEISEAPGR